MQGPLPAGQSASLVQVSPLLQCLPMSHASPASITPFPQAGILQSLRHESLLMLFPSSHSSPASFTPSRQRAGAQFRRHALGTVSEFAGPLSQISPYELSITLSPQRGSLQFVRQAFGVASLLDDPVSHCSAVRPPAGAVSAILSPHRANRQSDRQLRLGISAFPEMPSSHCSGASVVPLPQSGQPEIELQSESAQLASPSPSLSTPLPPMTSVQSSSILRQVPGAGDVHQLVDFPGTSSVEHTAPAQSASAQSARLSPSLSALSVHISDRGGSSPSPPLDPSSPPAPDPPSPPPVPSPPPEDTLPAEPALATDARDPVLAVEPAEAVERTLLVDVLLAMEAVEPTLMVEPADPVEAVLPADPPPTPPIPPIPPIPKIPPTPPLVPEQIPAVHV